MQGQAQKVLEHGAYWYIAGAAGTGKTDQTNKEAFDDWRIVSLVEIEASELQES